MKWRADSGMKDGSSARVDLTGGYHDAGDNVKFNFPMAFTTTMLSWSTLEYGKRMGAQLNNAHTAIRWATNYLLKCATATPGKLYVGVGDPNGDHHCWERPEDMDTPRTVYSVSASNPGSDVAGETAAALAAASLVFRKTDPAYSKLLLRTAKSVMAFALKYRGAYSDSLSSSVCPFYCSYSGYQDELLWGAAWLLTATKDIYYLNVLKSLGAGDDTDIFSWDNKYAGAHVLLSRRALLNHDKSLDQFRSQAENFMCNILPNSPSSKTHYTPGGLIYKMGQSNLQYVTSITFLLSTYAKYLMSTKQTFNCGSLKVTPVMLRALGKRQVDYILGENPMKMSYMVGYGVHFPLRIHHRGSSLPSKSDHPQTIGCDGGFQPFFYSSNPNPNILIGAVVGGPDQNDQYSDERTDYSQSEPATYINAALVGPLAYLVGSYG
ncbi:endoglucanase 3 [Aristolochia californica]|uniref:endoglucanase 3 n=1 Tax=Aristolochia californica TaxID=171875 RepID=UPI0035DB068A